MTLNVTGVLRGTSLLVGLLVTGMSAFGQAPAIPTGGTVNGADYSHDFAPGAIISIFGTNLATGTQLVSAPPLPTTLSGTTVHLTSGVSQYTLPIWGVTTSQINAQLPYDVPAGPATVTVTTSSGTSNADSITVVARAPKIFTLDFSGSGAAVATSPTYKVFTTAAPLEPGAYGTVWMNSMGATTGNPIAGQPAPGLNGTQPATVTDTTTVTVGGAAATVTFVGLSPGSSGLYQVNFQAPLVLATGPIPILVTVGGVTSQATITLPYHQLGFYYSLLGGKSVSGQTLNGVSGATSALAFMQSDQTTWGTTGLNAWTNNTGLGQGYSTVSGLALTLRNGTTVVYDNNGIETGTAGTFYNNTGGGADSGKPGLTDLYSMSNYFPLVFAGYFRLSQTASITELIGYFDASGNLNEIFDPANPYVKYRMNIWSSAAGLPSPTTFTGSVFSSDSTPGTFSYSDTGLKMFSSASNTVPKTIYRLSYLLSTPLTLPAGEYWFSHDASVRTQPATSSTSKFISVSEFRSMMSAAGASKGSPMGFSFFGQRMVWDGAQGLQQPVVVRPEAIVAPE